MKACDLSKNLYPLKSYDSSIIYFNLNSYNFKDMWFIWLYSMSIGIHANFDPDSYQYIFYIAHRIEFKMETDVNYR